jgi:hypothetical protein
MRAINSIYKTFCIYYYLLSLADSAVLYILLFALISRFSLFVHTNIGWIYQWEQIIVYTKGWICQWEQIIVYTKRLKIQPFCIFYYLLSLVDSAFLYILLFALIGRFSRFVYSIICSESTNESK